MQSVSAPQTATDRWIYSFAFPLWPCVSAFRMARSNDASVTLFIRSLRHLLYFPSSAEMLLVSMLNVQHSCVFDMCIAATCLMTSKGYEYNGRVSVTASGRTCQHWNTTTVWCLSCPYIKYARITFIEIFHCCFKRRYPH